MQLLSCRSAASAIFSVKALQEIDIKSRWQNIDLENLTI
jgi:hypothetical protein